MIGNAGGCTQSAGQSSLTISSFTDCLPRRAVTPPVSCTPPAERGFTPHDAGSQRFYPNRPRGLLELLAVKAARAVLRGDRRGNPPVQPD